MAVLALSLILLVPSVQAAALYQVSARTLEKEAGTSVLLGAGGRATLVLPVAAAHPLSIQVFLDFDRPAAVAPGWGVVATLLPPTEDLPKVRQTGEGPRLSLGVWDLNEAPSARSIEAPGPEEARSRYEEGLGERGSGSWRLQLSLSNAAPGQSLRVDLRAVMQHLESQVLSLVTLSGPGVAAHPAWQWSLLALIPASAGLGWYAWRMGGQPVRAPPGPRKGTL